MLRNELAGDAQYLTRVKYRFVPWIWSGRTATSSALASKALSRTGSLRVYAATASFLGLRTASIRW